MEGPGVRLRSLASGSNGNCTLLQAGRSALFIDAGISARAALVGLADAGLDADAVRGVLITHEHADHVRGLAAIARRLRAPIVANHATLRACGLSSSLPTAVLATGDCLELGDIRVASFPTSHDAAEPVGYLLTGGGRTIGYATDTGCAAESVRRHLRGVDLAIVEANHDVERLLAGPYPPPLKERILSDAGHLSNASAAQLIVDLLTHRADTEVWLAHLSAVNNSPQLARRTVHARLAEAGFHGTQVQVAPRGRPGPLWDPGACRQLCLF